jgi:NADH-quinone oxidoreductase subunit F
MAEGFDAVFISAGAQSSKRIGIPGEDENISGLYYGLQFLAQIKSGTEIKMQGKVIVIGGGNVAIDVARTALRAGASDVQLFCLEARDEMPAWEKEVSEAIEEGIVVNASWGPKRILNDEGKAAGVEFVKCLAVLDEKGQFNPDFDEETTKVVGCDRIIISIGQAPDMSFLSKDSQLERALWGTLIVDENTLSTNIPGIFAGGDFTTGPTFAIRAIASGRRASIAIDRYLRGDKGRITILDQKTEMAEDLGLALDGETKQDEPRIEIELEDAEERVKDFREVERGFTEAQARQEALRCLRCDLEERDT